MGLKEQIKAGLATGYAALDNVPVATTLRKYSESHDTATALTTRTSTDYAISGAVFGRFTEQETATEGSAGAGRDVRVTDYKILYPQSQTTVAPEEGDDIVRSDGTYRIVAVFQDPVSFAWSIQARKH